MLIEIIINENDSISVNVNHIIHVQPNNDAGCNIFVVGGISWYTKEEYTRFIGRVRSVYKSYMSNK